MEHELLSKEVITSVFYFFDEIVKDFDSQEYCLPSIKFVFNKNDIKELESSLLKEQYDKEIINTIIKNLNELYDEYVVSEDKTNYIVVKDYKNFFQLIHKVKEEYRENSSYMVSYKQFLESILLRVGVNDINNIEEFLKKQINFIKNDNLFEENLVKYKEFCGCEVYYQNKSNNAFFETNKHLKICLIRNEPLKSDDIFDVFNSYNDYDLPAIHYALIKENDKPTCYIYGIQDLGNRKKDEIINDKLKEQRKKLKNKYVSPDFILALKLVIDLLRLKGIEIIKVPLLQVYNYEFHENLAMKLAKDYEQYSKNQKDEKDLEYNRLKKIYDKYVDNEDLISKNKTERLIYTFEVMNNYFQNIEITTEPFINDDALVCKIVNDRIHDENINGKTK